MALSFSPAYPVIDDDVTITSTTAKGTHSVIRIDLVPPSSDVELGLSILPYSGEAPRNALEACDRELDTAIFTPDVAGEYGISLFDVREVPGLAATDSDRGGEYRFQYVAVDTGTLHVGAIIDLPIRTSLSRGATLRLKTNDTYVRASSLEDHTDDNVRALEGLSSVTVKLNALVGVTSSSMGNELIAGANDLRLKYEAHRIVAPAVHNAADAVNVIARDPAGDLEGAIQLVNYMRDIILAHIQEDQARTWHNVEDWKHVPLAQPAKDLASATVLLADMRERIYEPHRVDTNSHNGADAVNALTANTSLDDVIVAYFDAMVSLSPPVVAGEPEGAHDAASNFGFRIRTDL